MLIPCPVCGLRDHAEFTYGGDATLERPDIDDTRADVWANFVYQRANPRGPHTEFWHHAHGCRHWLIVERDTANHRVNNARLAGGWAPRKRGGAA